MGKTFDKDTGMIEENVRNVSLFIELSVNSALDGN